MKQPHTSHVTEPDDDVGHWFGTVITVVNLLLVIALIAAAMVYTSYDMAGKNEADYLKTHRCWGSKPLQGSGRHVYFCDFGALKEPSGPK